MDRRLITDSGECARDAFWTGTLRSTRRRLRGYLSKSGDATDEIKKIIADVYAELMENEAALIAHADPWEFILPIARRCSAAAKRRSRCEVQLDEQEVPVSEWSEREEAATPVEEWDEWVLDALCFLPPKQRRAIELHILQGHSYTRIAARTHVAEGVVRKRVHDGLKRLRYLATHRNGGESQV
jgi:RNA polymerase sigma factor (sigma-70 family)